MRKLQLLALMTLLASGHGMHAAWEYGSYVFLDEDEIYVSRPNPFDNQFDSQLQFRIQPSINDRDENGDTLLIKALYEKNIQKVEKLIKHGADVNQQSGSGHTPLHWAVAGHHYTVIRLLLDAGADTTIRNNYGHTPKWYITDETTRAIFDEADETPTHQINNSCSIS